MVYNGSHNDTHVCADVFVGRREQILNHPAGSRVSAAFGFIFCGMNNGHIYFEIQADNPARAITFYSQVFGWKFDEVKGLPVPYWRIETGGSRGGLLKRPAKTPPLECGANAFVCSLEVEDFDESAKRIEQLGGRVVLPKFAVPKTCWQGYFADAERNTFGIFQVDVNAK